MASTIESTLHMLVRAKPCIGSLWSGRPNCGKTTGTPPRMGCVPSNTAPGETKMISSRWAVQYEVRVAPHR